MDDETCLKLIQQGGQAAQQGIAVLYQRYAPRLTGHLIRHFRCTPEAAEDVVQDAFVNIVQDIRSKATNRREIALQSVRAWIWRITINRATDMVRSAAYRYRTPEAASVVEEDHRMEHHRTPEEAPDAELVDCVRRSWRAFTANEPERAEALQLAILEGWTDKELADFLGRTYGATRQYLRNVGTSCARISNAGAGMNLNPRRRAHEQRDGQRTTEYAGQR